MIKRASRSWSCCLALLALTVSVKAQTTIVVDPVTRLQTLTGWECVSFAAQSDPAFPAFKDALFDRVINEAGINRIRLEVRSGAENSTDYFALYQSGQVDYATWRANRYATGNDNADPVVINAAGYHFTELDQNVETTILPLRALAGAKGESLYITSTTSRSPARSRPVVTITRTRQNTLSLSSLRSSTSTSGLGSFPTPSKSCSSRTTFHNGTVPGWVGLS